MATPIFQIRQMLEDGTWSENYPIGSTFENIHLNDSLTSITLMDYYNYMKSALADMQYIRYGTEEPTSTNVKVWYDTTG